MPDRGPLVAAVPSTSWVRCGRRSGWLQTAALVRLRRHPIRLEPIGGVPSNSVSHQCGDGLLVAAGLGQIGGGMAFTVGQCGIGTVLE